MPKLLPVVIRLLAETNLTRREIAIALDKSDQWVSLLESGRIRDPGVNSIEKLYTLLTGKELDIDG